MSGHASQAEALAAAKDIIAPWTQACLDRDWDKLLSMCTKDIVFMPQGMPPVSGDEVRPWLESFPTITAMSWDVERLEASDDIAFLNGPLRQTLEMEEGTHQSDGKFCDLMRREADGQWRFAVIMWSENHS